MAVSVETLSGLERKITISVPAEEMEEEIGLRLRSYANKANMKGFRPGKAPADLIKKRYSSAVREEVARDKVQPTLAEAFKELKLTPAGYPEVTLEELEAGKDFKYSATFEVFPEIKIKELDGTQIELIEASVTEQDIDDMINKLRSQNKDWESVDEAAASGDKVKFDFKGFINDEPFPGGEAKDYELELGSGSMIPGFEDALQGHKSGESFDIHVNFPESYNHKELAGKEAKFEIKLHQVLKGSLPELNDAFAENFNIKEGGIEAFKKDIAMNMERELERKVSSANRETIFDAFMKANTFDLPKALIDNEIENLKHDMYHRIFGHEHSENEKIPDFPRELFVDQATRRVHLGLLFSEYVKLHKLEADEARVNDHIEKLANAYEDPDELRHWYKDSKENLSEIKGFVLEEMVAEKVCEHAKTSKKTVSYEEAMNPKKDSETEGE